MRRRVHRGADHLRVVQIETAYVEGDVVPAEGARDDPPAPFAQQRQSLTHQLSGHDVECDVDGQTRWGVGIDSNIVTASLAAVASAANRRATSTES